MYEPTVYRESTVDRLVSYVPNIIMALVILVVGALIAWLIAAAVRWAFRKTRLDERLERSLRGESAGQPINTEKWVGILVFWTVMLFVLIGVFSALDAPAISQPLNELLSVVLAFIPKLIGAALLLVLAWILAKVVRVLVLRGVRATGIDERVNRHLPEPREEIPSAPARRVDLARSLADAAYWLVFLLFLPMILEVLDLDGLLQPLVTMLESLLAFLPRLLAAALILAIGWFVARVIRNVVAGLLAASGVDRFTAERGLAPAGARYSISEILAWVIYILILIPVVIAALEALRIEAITEPAVRMLNAVLLAIPRLFGAAILLILAWVVGKLVANIVANLLDALGFNRMLSQLGFMKTPALESGAPRTVMARQPSEIAGYAVLVAIMLFATAEALRLLEFNGLAALVLGFLVLLGNVVLGLIIIAVGLALAQWAASAIRSSNLRDAATLATAARIAIVVLAVAMGLGQMGLAASIINLAFGLTLGAVAVAAAIAFGLGGRDIAHRQLERWYHRVERPDIVSAAESELPRPGTTPPGESQI